MKEGIIGEKNKQILSVVKFYMFIYVLITIITDRHVYCDLYYLFNK